MAKLKVIQIDAWRYDDGWTYNDSFPLCYIEVKGEPTTRKILRSMRLKNLISQDAIYEVDNYFDYEGTWTIQRKNTGKPLFDVKLETE